MASFELFYFGDDVVCVRESLTFQLREDQGAIQHHFKGGGATHLSADDGGGIRVEDIIS